MMNNNEMNLELYRAKYKRNIFIRAGIVIACILIIAIITLFNDLIFKIIGFSKFAIFYILGFILCSVYLILEFKLKLDDKDKLFSLLHKTKKEEEFYQVFPEQEKYKLSKKGKVTKIFSIIMEYYVIISIAVLLVVFIFSFVFFPAEVEQHSMENTLYEGNRVLVFNTHKADKQDIIVFEYDSKYQNENVVLSGDFLIKRVIAKAGDTFYCLDGNIYVNGELVVEDYVTEDHMKKNSYTLSDVINKNTNKEYILSKMVDGKIPSGYYLVLGDNRSNSNDSEEFGLVYYKQIIGVVRYYKNEFGWKKA